MIRIDAHQHFWRYQPQAYPWIDDAMPALRRDWLPTDLQPLMAAQGIDACIAVQARADEVENTFLLELADAHPCVAAVVGWVDLFSADAHARLAHWRTHPRFAGVRHLLQDDADVAATLADANFNAGVRAVQSQRLVFEVLVRGAAQLDATPQFCARHDAHPLVLDHLGKPEIGSASGGGSSTDNDQVWASALRRLAVLPHVSCKLSGLVTEVRENVIDPAQLHRYLDIALEAFGPQRLMFGSDWPVCLLRAEYAEVAAMVRDWSTRLSHDEQAALWGGNAVRCYGLQNARSCQTPGPAPAGPAG